MASLATAGPAHAQYVVTQTTDDGTGGTAGTLSNAILQANATGGTISFNLNGGATTLTQTGNMFALNAAAPITITGGGITLDGQGFNQFNVDITSSAVNLQNLTLIGGNTQGDLIISTGTLQIGNGGTTGTISSDIFNDAVLAFDRLDTVTYAGVMSGSGVLEKRGAGTLVLSGANSFAGGLNILEGTVRLEHNTAAGMGLITTFGSVIDYANGVDIANDIVISSDTTQFQVLGGSIAFQSGMILDDGNTRPLEKIGDGTLVVSSVNNSGPTLISEGTWLGGQALAFSANSAHTVAAGATLDLGGFDQSIDSLFGAGTVINSGVSDAVLALGNFGFSTTQSVFSGVIADGGPNTLHLMVDAPKLTLTGANTYTGGTLICDCATLQIGNGGTTGSIVGEVTNNGFLIFNRSDAYEFSGNILQGFGNPGVVEQQGSGILTLSGTNSHAGGTVISNGTLRISSDANLGDPFGVGGVGIANGAILSFSNDLSLDAARTIVLNGGGVIDTGGSDSEILGDITGTGGLTVNGGGSLYLGGFNDFTGGTIIASGILNIDDDARLGDISGGVTFLGGSGLRFSSDVSLDAGRTITLGAGAGVIDTDSNDSEIFGTITGTGGLIVNGGGYLYLGGANDFTGGLSVSDQTFLAIDNDGALGAASNGITLNDGGLFFENDMVVGAGRTLTLAGGENVLDTGPYNVEIAARITGVGRLVVTGGCGCTPGATLSGINDYSGGTLVDFGSILTITADHNLGAVPGGLTLRGGELDFAADTILDAGRTITLDTVGGVFGPNGFTATIPGNIIGDGDIVLVGPGTLVLAGNNSHSGSLIVDGGTMVLTGTDSPEFLTGILSGTLQIGNGGTTGALISTFPVLNFGSLTFNRSNSYSFDTEILGSGRVEQIGSGTTTLTAVNAYDGGTVITAGTLAMGNNDALGVGTVTLNGGALQAGANSLDLLNDVAINGVGGAVSVTGSDSFTISGVIADGSGSGGFQKTGSGTLILGAANTYSGGTTLSAGTLQIGADANLGGASSGVTFNGGTLTFSNDVTLATTRGITLGTGGGVLDTSSGQITAAGVITGSGSVTKTGSGTLVLDTGHNYAGVLTIGQGALRITDVAGRGAVFNAMPGGSLIAGNATAIAFTGASDAGAATRLVADGGGVFNFSGTTGAGAGLINAGSIEGAGNFLLGANTLTVGALGTSTNAGGAISGTGGLTKVGAGTLTLSGVSTYTGLTTINAGALSVNGTIASTVMVAGGSLKGTGTIGGAILTSGTTLAPGNSIGTLNVTGNVSFAAGSIYEVEVNAAGQSDRINAGSANLNGAVQVLPEVGNYAFETTYRIIDATGGVSGSFAGVTSANANLIPTLVYGTGSVDLRLTRNDVQFGTQFGVTANQIAVGSAASAGGVASPFYRSLGLLSASAPAVRAALDGLSGEIHATLLASQLGNAALTRHTLMDRMRGQEAGAQGLSLWGQTSGNWASMDGDGNAAGTNSSGVNVTLGADISLEANWRAGLEAGYGHSNLNLAARGSSAAVSTGHLGAYAHGQYDAIRLRTGFVYGFGTADTLRGVNFTGFSNAARASQDVSNVQLFGEAGYRVAAGSLNLEPFVGLAWSRLELGAFNETGGVAALGGMARSADEGYFTLGVDADTSGFAFAGGLLTPGLRAGWQHALNNGLATRNVSYLSTGQSFAVRGTPLDADRAVVDVDLALALGGNTSVTLGYFGSYAARGSEKGVRLMGVVRF